VVLVKGQGLTGWISRLPPQLSGFFQIFVRYFNLILQVKSTRISVPGAVNMKGYFGVVSGALLQPPMGARGIQTGKSRPPGMAFQPFRWGRYGHFYEVGWKKLR